VLASSRAALDARREDWTVATLLRALRKRAKWRSGGVHRRRGGRGDHHDPWRGRAAVEGRRCYCQSMRCLQAWLPQRTRSPTTKTPGTAAMRTIHSSTFNTKNSVRPDFFASF